MKTKKPTVININIETLIDTVIIESKNSFDELKQAVAKTLIKAVEESEMIDTNNKYLGIKD